MKPIEIPLDESFVYRVWIGLLGESAVARVFAQQIMKAKPARLMFGDQVCVREFVEQSRAATQNGGCGSRQGIARVEPETPEQSPRPRRQRVVRQRESGPNGGTRKGQFGQKRTAAPGGQG